MRGRGGLEIPPPLVLGGVLAVPRGVAEGRPGAMSSGAAAMTAASSAARTCGGASSLGASRGATSSGVSVAPNRRLGRVAPRAAPMRAQDRAPRAVAPGADGRNRVEPNFTPKAPRGCSDVVVPSAVSDPRAAVRVEDEFHSREAALRATADGGGAAEDFYSWLYVGLFREARGDAEGAREAMLAAVDTPYGRKSGDYMAALAEVHLKRRGWA